MLFFPAVKCRRMQCEIFYRDLPRNKTAFLPEMSMVMLQQMERWLMDHLPLYCVASQGSKVHNIAVYWTRIQILAWVWILIKCNPVRFDLSTSCVSSPQQDAANKNGGKWIVRLRKGLASRCWENMILAMLGEQFMVGDEICGAVISVRFQVKRRKRSCCGKGLHVILCSVLFYNHVV